MNWNKILSYKFNNSLNQASHNGTMFLLFDDKESLITGPFHCKDFFNEPLHSFYHTNEDDSIYGYRWKAKDNVKIENANYLNLVLYNIDFTFETDELKKKVGDFIVKYTEELGFRNWIRKIRMYNTHLEVDFSKQITKYPVMFSIFTYIIRTALEHGNLEEALLNDTTYYTHHNKFKKFLEYNSKTSKDLLKINRWSDFKKNNIPYSTSDKRPTVHNNSGFMSFLDKQIEIINNKIKIKKNEQL